MSVFKRKDVPPFVPRTVNGLISAADKENVPPASLLNDDEEVKGGKGSAAKSPWKSKNIDGGMSDDLTWQVIFAKVNMVVLKHGFHLRRVVRTDNNSLTRSAASIVLGDENQHMKVRRAIADALTLPMDDPYRISGGSLHDWREEAKGLSQAFNAQVQVFDTDGITWSSLTPPIIHFFVPLAHHGVRAFSPCVPHINLVERQKKPKKNEIGTLGMECEPAMPKGIPPKKQKKTRRSRRKRREKKSINLDAGMPIELCTQQTAPTVEGL
jgi:hypothetical protein